jgi:hypothetical protein
VPGPILQVGDTLKNSIVWSSPSLLNRAVGPTVRSTLRSCKPLLHDSSTLYIHVRKSFVINQFLYIQNRKPFVINESMVYTGGGSTQELGAPCRPLFRHLRILEGTHE